VAYGISKEKDKDHQDDKRLGKNALFTFDDEDNNNNVNGNRNGEIIKEKKEEQWNNNNKKQDPFVIVDHFCDTMYRNDNKYNEAKKEDQQKRTDQKDNKSSAYQAKLVDPKKHPDKNKEGKKDGENLLTIWEGWSDKSKDDEK